MHVLLRRHVSFLKASAAARVLPSGSLCRDPALGVFLALGAQVIFFAPVAGQFLILGAPDAFFAPVVLGISGVYVQCGLILHIFSRNSRMKVQIIRFLHFHLILSTVL